MFFDVKPPQLQVMDGIFYKNFLALLQPLAKGIPAVYGIITFILLIAQAIGLNKIVNNLPISRKAYVPPLISAWFV